MKRPARVKAVTKEDRMPDHCAEKEKEDIKKIILDLNDSQSSDGNKIRKAFHEKYGKEIHAARERKGADRKTHYDFEILVGEILDGSEWKRVEHKGSLQLRIPKEGENPWSGGVEFHNGGCEKYNLAWIYAQVYYNEHIASGNLSREFGLTSAIPSCDEWYKRDCKSQGNPRTAFGKELKKKVRDKRGPRSSLLEKRNSVLQKLEINDEQTALFKKNVLAVANQALEEKDYWLSIYGDLDGDFNAYWYDKFIISDIVDVKFKKELDLLMEFTCSDGFTFNGILRWGKGAGFSNLRIDLK